MESGSKLNENIKYLDQLLLNLPQPNIDPVTHVKKKWSLSGWGNVVTTKISKNITSWQSGKHVNESGAKEFLIACINDPELKDSLKNHSEKIIKLYERLAHLSNGANGTWADGIDRELLVTSTEIIDEEEEPLIRDLKTRIFNNILPKTIKSEKLAFVSEDLSIEDDWIEPLEGDISDLAGLKHVFKKIDGQSPPTNRILFQICADEFGLGSELEGGKSLTMITYLHSFLVNSLKNNNENPYFSEIIDEFKSSVELIGESFSDIKSIVDRTRNQIIHSLERGKPRLILGGWCGKPHGHAIYYEIIPDKNGTVNFRLYNTGSGIDHHLSVRDGHKIKYLPYCEWKGITKDKVLSNNFLQSLYELNTHTADEEGGFTNFNADDIYVGLKRILSPSDEISKGEEYPAREEFMSPQRSGVCSFRSLMAFMHSKMKLADYKRFKCDFKLQVLCDFLETYQNNNNVKVEDWRLIRKTHQSICRSIIKLYEKKLVGDDYITSVQKLLKDSADWIDANEKCRYQSNFSPIKLTYTSCSLGKTIVNKHTLDVSLQEKIEKKDVKDSVVQNSGLTFEALKRIQLNNATSIYNDLESVTEIAKKSWLERDDISLHVGLMNLTTRLNLESEFWMKAIASQPEMAEKLIVQLGDISNYFLKSCFTTPHPSIINPEKIYVFKKIIYLQNLICHLRDPNSEWENLAFTKFNHESFYNIITDTKMRSDIAFINAAYSSRSHNNNVNLIDLKRVSPESFVGLKIIMHRDDNTVEKIIRRTYPTVIQEIKKSDKGFDELPEKCQDAHIFASDLLPPWLKAMRDTCLAGLHLQKSDVGPLTSLDRNVDIVTRFKIDDFPGLYGSFINVSLVGVNKEVLNDLEVKRIKEDKLNFAGNYSNENSPILKEIESIALSDYDYDSSEVNEKQLFQMFKNSNDTNLKEIAHVFLNKKLSHIEALEYFTNHPEKLKDRDFQILLHITIFGSNLESKLKIKGFENQLAHFIHRNYHLFLEENEIHTAVFLLKISNQLKHFCSDNPVFKEAIIELEKLIHRKEVGNEEKSIIYAELVAQIGSKDILNSNDVKSILIGSIYLKENQIDDSKKRDPETMRKVDEVLLRHATQIRQFLEDGTSNQHLLNEIFNTLRPKAGGDKVWEIKSEKNKFPHFATSDGEYFFYPMNADLQSVEGYNLIPTAIRENALFKVQFPDVKEAKIISGNIYSFNDQGYDCLVYLNGDTLIIEKKLFQNDPHFYRLIPSNNFIFEDEKEVKSQIGSRIIAQNYTIWQILDNQPESIVFVALNKSGKVSYKFSGIKEDSNKIFETSKKQRLERENNIRKEFSFFDESDFKMLFEKLPSILDPQYTYFRIDEVRNIEKLKLGKTSQTFTHFEDPGYIHEWYDTNNKLVRVDLPRFHLTFTADAKTGKLSSEKFKGFYLNSSKEVPNLGVHKNFIALENSKGECKILLPVQRLLKPKIKEVLLPRYDMEKNLLRGDVTTQKYFVYELATNGELTNKSTEANFYLAQILATVQQYKKAIQCLKKFGNKLTQFSEKEKFLLEEITRIGEITGDNSGNGASIRLFAHYLLLKNTSLHELQLSKSQVKNIGIQYGLYLNHFNNISVYKLTNDQEIFILKALLLENYDASYQLRLDELDPSASRKFVKFNPYVDLNTDPIVEDFVIIESSSELSKKREQDLEKNNDIYDFVFSNTDTKDFLTIDKVLMTRAHRRLSKYFEYYYEMARGGSEEQRNWLRGVIPFVSIVEGGKYSGMAKIFEAILEDPNKFSKVQAWNNVDAKLKKMWQISVREQTVRYFSEKSQDHSNADLRVQKDITSKHFRLDKKNPLKINIEKNELSNQNTKTNSNRLFPLSSWCEDVSFFNREIKPIDSNQVEDCKNIIQKIRLDDPVAQKEQQRLVLDFDSLTVTTDYQFNSFANKKLLKFHEESEKVLDNISRTIRFIFREDKINSFELSLKTLRFQLEHLKEDNKNIVSLKTNILNFANKEAGGDSKKNLNQLHTWAGDRKFITMDELIILYARKNVSALLRRNPALTKEDAVELMMDIERYMLLETQEQQRIRVDSALQKLETVYNTGGKLDTPEVQDYINDLATQALAVRSYNPTDNPAFIVFEYYSNIVMRPAQVEKLQAFLKGGDISLIMEMIMGSGKSKVLLPLLGLLRADGEKLSMLIVPQPLFESISHDVQIILQSFDQALHTLHFDRGTKFSEESLDGILDDLTNIRKNHECLIMTSKSVQCLLLKYIEKCAEHFSGPDKDKVFTVEIQTMRKILNLLGESGYPIIDEADSILNVLHEVSFSLGKCSPPQTNEFELISEIYSLIYDDPEISNLARIESNSVANPEGQPLTKELYFEKVQKPLVERFIISLATMTFQSPVLTDKMRKFVQDLDKKNEKLLKVNEELLKAYLIRDKTHSDEAQKYFDSLDEDIQDLIALAGEQFSHLLPYTLTKVCDVKYGLDFDENTQKIKSIFAIPFSATKTPSSGSQFANPHVTMNYTYQVYMKNGVTYDLVEEQVKILQGKAMKELIAGGKDMDISETNAWKAFNVIRGDINIPFKYTQMQLEALVNHINGNSEAKRKFLNLIILPQMEIFQSKISCNSHNLVQMFEHISGFTGTLWNALSMHHSLKPEPELGIDAKTLSILFKNSRNNVIDIKEGSSDFILQQLAKKSVDFDLISDAGGYFKDGSNIQIAHKLSNTFGKEVVCYREGEQVITEGDTDVPLAQSDKNEGDRLTFLDQSHTTGADVAQKRDAIGLVTVGSNMLLRDLLQSVWRLRGLDKSQKTRFLISHEVSEIIRQTLKLDSKAPIDFDHILSFVIINQATQKGLDAFKALRQELELIPQTMLLKVLMNDKIPPLVQLQAYLKLQSEWIKPAFLNARELYGTLPTMNKSPIVVERIKNDCVLKIKTLFIEMPWLEEVGISQKDWLSEVDLIVGHLENNVPLQLPSPSRNTENNQTVETQLKTATQAQSEVESEKSNFLNPQFNQAYIKGKLFKDYKTFQNCIKFIQTFSLSNPNNAIVSVGVDREHCPSFSVKSYFESDPALRSWAAAFEGIDMTANVLEWNRGIIGSNGSGKMVQPSDFNLFGENRIPFHHLSIKDSKITLMSVEQAGHYLYQDEYYNLTLGFNERERNRTLTESERLKIVKIKFLNGESQFDSLETELLKTWLKFQGAEHMKEFYEKFVISGANQKEKAIAYRSDSPLKGLFANL